MNIVLLQAPGGMDPGTLNLLFMGVLFAVAYFFLIRPQAKRNKEQQKFVDDVAKGDNIVTTSGIHGRVMEVEGSEVILQIDRTKGINIRISKAAISKEMTASAYPAAEKEKEPKSNK